LLNVLKETLTEAAKINLNQEKKTPRKKTGKIFDKSVFSIDISDTDPVITWQKQNSTFYEHQI